MSRESEVFNMLKYGSIDLDCKEELDRLPAYLLLIYKDIVNLEMKRFGDSYHIYENYPTEMMASWGTIGGNPKQDIFKKALKKYSDEPI